MRIYLSENHKDVQRTVHNTLHVILLLAYKTDNPFLWPHHFIYIKSKMFNLFQSFPDDAIGQSFEFERALCDLIILMSPFAPMFASELWRGVVNVQHMCRHYKRVRFW